MHACMHVWMYVCIYLSCKSGSNSKKSGNYYSKLEWYIYPSRAIASQTRVGTVALNLSDEDRYVCLTRVIDTQILSDIIQLKVWVIQNLSDSYSFRVGAYLNQIWVWFELILAQIIWECTIPAMFTCLIQIYPVVSTSHAPVSLTSLMWPTTSYLSH